ncbi:disco-interacting protein 2 isoform X10 [Episyrphus balteatus]|uniref:disco-interacting protein 2 isoform X10 n=1 Tax=Episyrphus balteatus TaxID=286459 RepID=UPI00248577C4|nr:disco-interacting protein 2 isoform X10 [Episyrphus balteatus]
MKPLTFESIRNFLRTKKKGKDKDGIGGGIMDASFKRSDSFKRISIRKSYLDRGRKRAALRAKAIGANTGSSLSGSGGSSSSNHHHHHQHCSPTTSSGTIVEELEANPIFKLDRKNDDYYHHHHHNRHHHNHRPATTSSIAQAKANNLPAAMMTVPEVKNGIFIGSLRRNSVAENEDEYNDEEDDDEDVYNGANSHSQSWLDPSRKPLSSSSSSKQETEIQVVSVDFQNSNSSETIYNDVLEEGDYTGCAGANVSNVSVGSLQDDDRSVISEENIYEKADSVRLDQSESKGITFKTFTPAKNYLETNFDTSQEELLDDFPTASSSKKSSDFSSQQNISKTTLIYEDPFDHIHRKQTKNFSGESIVIHISGTDNSNISDRSVGYPPKQEPSVRVEAAEEIIDHYQKEPLGNAKCTYEIFKELQMSKNEPTSPVKKTISRSSSFSEVHYGISTICEDPDQSPEYNKYQSFSFDPEVEMYDDADMISPDSSIPYPLRVKINPFTRQKELYAVNLGRIWKQLNLGQGDDLDMRGNFKKKNESFKSMSSRDSGFSLTLTKPKNIFRRRHAPEGNKDFRFQRNSSRKRKSRRHLAPIASPLELNPTQDHFVKEFEEFCMARRRRMKARKEYADDTFNQEINDLEAFFEEHLKRLKEYYLQRKKINDATLSEIYADMSPTEQTFEFPHPDKRVTNNKKKSKCLFQEVRTFNDEDHHHEEDAYASIGNHRDTEDLFHYPKHWRMTSPRKRTLGRGRNTGRRYKKSDAYKSRKEISLASVFPSVYDSDAIASSVHHGGRSRRQSKQVPPTNPDGTCSYCFKRMRDASRRCSSIASDEFSEQEFLSNCDVCWNCDNHLADCICAPTPSTDYCSCRHALLAAANSESPCGRKKIRRKKSKRKVGKNHSTLRRRCTGSDITQKGYEKKRSRLLQPYMTKGNQDTTTDDESIPEERISTPDREYNYPRDHINNSREQIIKPPIRDSSVGGGHKNFSDRRPQQNLPPPPHSDTSSAGSPPAVHRKNNYDFTDISDFQRPYVAPDITQFNNTRRGADRVTRYVNISQTDAGDTGTAGRWKVSAKIQQLLNTLKRPKRRPLPEFYEDNDIELEIAANPKDPNAPKPEGSTMSSVQGEQLAVAAQLPRSLEAALQRFGTNSFKSPMATVLDPNGKMTTTLTYGKLLSRAQKIAYALTTKVFSKGPEQITLKPGDRVALVYPNSDPLSFITAWYGCMFRGLVPLPIELPLSSSDTPPQQVGFLLSSCGISVALTSEACLKGLPKSSTGEIAKLKGWPRLHWFVTEHLPKPPKDFNVGNVRIEENASAYVEYTSDKEGSVMGVTVTRQAMMNHCRALTMACHYTEGETSVCVLDFKREVGLWHAVLTSVLNGMHVLFIPYALMKQRPSSWMQLITKHRASCCLVKSRDLHWGLLATKDHKDISLSSLRMLLVADGANPWSLSSCDQFLSVFQSKGLRSDAICPCASSSEVFTVSLRRPGRSSSGFTQSATGRGVLSMAALSHGVVRVDSEDSLTSLTLQDCGQVMPAAQMVVVRSEGTPVLCKTDQVGEICVTSGATGTAYYGLEGLTNTTFKVQPLVDDPDPKDPNTGKPICDEFFVRSGLLGFLGPGGLVFVCGSRDGLMTVTGRKHNADDIIATVLAVEPMRFIYRGRIAVFSIKVLRDERVCVIAEQRPDCSEEESFQWMSRVLQAVDSIHQVGIYCLALVPPNHLPKTPLGGIHLCEARRRFLEGSLHPANVLMCPHTCVTNLPKPREIHQAVQPTTTSSSLSGCGITDTSVGPASVMVGNLVQGNRLAMAQGRDIGLSEDSERKHQLITGVLRWRANSAPDHVLYTLLNSKGAVAKTLTCSELHKRAEKIAALLQERGKIEPGDHVALIFPPGLDLICAFYGCLYLGAVPITIRPPHPQNLITTLPTVRMIVDVSKSGIVLSIQSIIKLLKSREAAASIDPKSWPPILDIDDNPKRKLAAVANSTLDSTAYLDFSVSTCGRLSGVIITNRSLSSVCASLKLACELYPSRHVALCLDPYCGLGFAMWTLISVYSGHHSILIAPYEVEANPSLWLSTLSQYRVRDTFCSYGVIELCTKALSNSIPALKQRNVDLRCVRTCVVVAEERPRVQLTQQFCKLFQALGLNTRCVSTSFGCRVNPAICVQGASSAESAQVYVDLRALRNNRVALVERGAPNSLCLIESGKLLPGVKVIIANPETKGHCGDSHLGEIWVQSPHSANGYFTIYGDETDYNDHFNAKLVTGATTEVYARTGYLGFLRRTECSQAVSILDETTPSIASRDSDTESLHSMSQLQHNLSSISIGNQSGSGTNNQDQELHDAVYVVGALDEVITLRGMNYHPIDIENSVLRCHKKIAECAVFTWTNLLVVVVELDGNESEALDLVPLVTNTVLEEHQLIVGVVVVVDPGVVPINSRGEKQRMHLRDGFLADQLDPIYVAYNM